MRWYAGSVLLAVFLNFHGSEQWCPDLPPLLRYNVKFGRSTTTSNTHIYVPGFQLSYVCFGKHLYGGCRKFLLLFGRIGPLTLRPCALLRAWGFLPHSINILQIPLWYGDMMWYGVSCARPCALLRGLHFWCLYIVLSKSYLPRRCDWKGRFFFIINPHIAYICFVSTSEGISWHLCSGWFGPSLWAAGIPPVPPATWTMVTMFSVSPSTQCFRGCGSENSGFPV